MLSVRGLRHAYDGRSVLSIDEWSVPQGEASLIITNKRLVIRTGSGKIAAVKFGPTAKIFLYCDGLRLEKTVGSTALRFKSKSEETAEILAELLTAVNR